MSDETPVDTERRPCETCGRKVQHTPDGRPQPHMEPRPGGVRCKASPTRPGRG